MHAKQWLAEGARGYGIGMVAIVIAVAVRLILDPSLEMKSPFLLFSAAVLTASWFGGWMPGFLTTLLAALVGDTLFLSPIASFKMGHSGDALALGLFLIEGIFISLAAGQLRRDRARAEQAVGAMAELKNAEKTANEFRLEILGRERIDLLLSDIEMPGTDGYQLIRKLRLRPSQQGGAVPAVALTAYARTEDRLRSLRAGFQLHLSRTVQPSVTVVASLAARRN